MKSNFKNFVKQLDERVKYDLFVTLPLQPKYHSLSDIELSTLLKSFIVNLNRKIFTRLELNDRFSPRTIECIPIREDDETCVHIIAKCPTSKRLPDDSFKYMRFKKILIKEIRRMKLFEPNQVSKKRHYFDCKKKNKNKIYKNTECEIVETNIDYLFNFYKKISTNAVDLISYTTKRRRNLNLDTIDFTNVRVVN